MRATPPLVAVNGLALSYRGRPALRGVDLDLMHGEALVLLGPNGAGKSSLLRIVAGRLRPDAGSVRVGGGDPCSARAVRRTLGWVPQEIALYPRLTVAENLDVFARLAGVPGARRRRIIPEILDQTGTGGVRERLVGTLSGGFQRRVNIAASLVAQPALILLDEPTQGVDLEAREAIHVCLLNLRAAGAALLLSTHDFAEAERLAERVAILSDGRVLRQGSLRDLLRPFATTPPHCEARLDRLPDHRAQAVLVRHGFSASDDPSIWHAAEPGHEYAGEGLNAAGLLAALRRDGVAVLELRLRRPGLDTAYRQAFAPARREAPTPVRRPARATADAAS